MKTIKAAHFDADGVLIVGGDFYSTPINLKKAIAELRESGVLFNLASGRPLFEQQDLFRIITENAKPKRNEGILYEASAVHFWGKDEIFSTGGLTSLDLDRLESFIIQHGLMTGMVPQQNQRRYTTQLGYVTPTFRSDGVTNKELLKAVYVKVKPILEGTFPFVQVGLSADAIDIMAKGVSKDKPAVEYARWTGISLDETAAIGDSDNDMAMLKIIADAGGFAGYVGTNNQQKETIRRYRTGIVPDDLAHRPLLLNELEWIYVNQTNFMVNPEKQGPFKAITVIKTILRHNAQAGGP